MINSAGRWFNSGYLLLFTAQETNKQKKPQGLFSSFAALVKKVHLSCSHLRNLKKITCQVEVWFDGKCSVFSVKVFLLGLSSLHQSVWQLGCVFDSYNFMFQTQILSECASSWSDDGQESQSSVKMFVWRYEASAAWDNQWFPDFCFGAETNTSTERKSNF